MDRYQKICAVGLGYIGLPTASLLATKGFKVTGVYVFENAVDTINRGGIHIVEPDIGILVKSSANSGNLTASLGIINDAALALLSSAISRRQTLCN